MANFVSLKLNDHNFLLWKSQRVALLESQEHFEFLTGEKAPMLCSSMLRYIRRFLILLIWISLVQTFSQKSQEREFQLIQRLTSLKKDHESLVEYVRKLKKIRDDLIAIGKSVGDSARVF